jgi:oligoendopeptidase F
MPATRRDVLASSGALALASALPAAAADTSAPPATWVLTDLYASPEAWQVERAAVQAALPGITGFKGKLGADAATLRAALQALSDAQRKVARLSTYASILADSDTAVGANQERRQQAIALGGQLAEAASYLQPEILAVGAAKAATFQKSDPALGKFGFQLGDILRRAPHTLGAEAEGVLAAASTPLAGAQQTRTQLVDSDLPWPEVTLSTGKVRLDQAAYTAAREAPNREDRKKVFEAFFGTFEAYKTSLASALSTQVQTDVFTAKARHYASALECALDGAGGVPTGPV